VAGRILLCAMARGLTTLAEALDPRPRAHLANFHPPRLQRVALDLQDFELRKLGLGILFSTVSPTPRKLSQSTFSLPPRILQLLCRARKDDFVFDCTGHLMMKW
jgi:hypothetical protein